MLAAQNWTEAGLQGLIAAGREEDLQLEFKRAIANDDGAKKELSKDVSAFANTIGGYIIYGIAEDPVAPHKAIAITPIDPRTISKEWLEQVINSRIQPRIIGIRIHPIDLPATALGQVAYVVEIPESSTAHQAYDNRYYRRFNFQSVAMADHEVRQAMNRAVKPAYAAWFLPWKTTQHGQNAVVAFAAKVVNTSEMSPTIISAALYLPSNEFALRGDPWDFAIIEGAKYRRFEATIESQPYPGRPSRLGFDGANVEFNSENPPVASAIIHLKLFDEYGLALHNVYELALPGLTHGVVLTESDRRPSAVSP